MHNGRKHLVIPDTQIKPGVPLDHLRWAGEYAAEKKPDVITLIGDWADMSSLSSYDAGKKCYEGRTYKEDIEVANDGLAMFMHPIKKESVRTFSSNKKRWDPQLEYRRGNHEERINIAIELDRKLDGTISVDHLKFADFGFNVLPFLEVGVVDGIAYAHYFTSGVMGRPITTARALLTKKHMSCVAGHQQGKDIACDTKADGSRITAIIAGSYYQHDEAYMGPQGNKHWRGLLMLHEVDNGSFDEMPVSLSFLKERYA